VEKKSKKCLEDMDKFIKENHRNESGIVYCLSRIDCEKVAEKLQVKGVFDSLMSLQNQLKTSCGVVFESLGLHRKNPYWLYWRCSSQGYTIQLHIDMCHAQAYFALLKKLAPRKHLKQHVLVSLGF
jgi:hypothetical protein